MPTFDDFNNVFITGGSGTLGKEIINFHISFDAPRITVYSRDPMKQFSVIKAGWVHCVIGDVRDRTSLFRAMAGHDLVIHAAAMKHIPQAERDPDACYEINVQGSRNVLDAALRHGIQDVMLISTDKACHPVNVYGCTKMMMERLAFTYQKAGMNIYIPRYGNVIDSTGSVLQLWKKQLVERKSITITDPKMTRFWLTPHQAVKIIIESLKHPNFIYVPRLPALSIMKFAEYVLGKDFGYEIVGLRPGEKIHEELLTEEESAYASWIGDEAYLVRDPMGPRGDPQGNYSGDKPARELSRKELREMLELEDE